MKYRLLLFHAVCVLVIHLALANKSVAQVAVDVTVTDAGSLHYVTPGTYAVIPTVKSLDMDYAISHLNANWQLDGGEIHTTYIDDFMLYGDLYPGFKSRMVLDSVTFTTTGTHVLKVWTDTPGGFPDTNPANDTAWLDITVCDSLPDKKVLIWYGTHVDCFPCGGYGEGTIDSINHLFPDDAIVIRAHDEAADPYVCDESTEINNLYIWPYTGHPAWIFDQFTFPCLSSIVPFELFPEQWIATGWRMDYRYPVDVTITDAEIDTVLNVINANINATFYADYTGALNINAAITEDSIYGYQAGYPGEYMYHTHVLRATTAGVEGESGIIPVNASAGETYTYAITKEIDAAWDRTQLYLTGYVMVGDDAPLNRHILNAERIYLKTKSEEDTTVQTAINAVNDLSLHIYPNPANDMIMIKSVDKTITSLAVEIFSSDGRKVFETDQVMADNDGIVRVNIASLHHGIYLVRMHHDKIAGEKMIVVEH